MIFLEREVKEQEDGVVVGVGCPLAEQLRPLISTEKVHAVAKSTLSKVQIPRCRKRQSPPTLSEVDVVQNPTLSKKMLKFGRNLTRSGVRVRGLGLVWTSALTRSDRDQQQTRSRTRHRNLTRFVWHVILTSLLLSVFSGGCFGLVRRYRLVFPDHSPIFPLRPFQIASSARSILELLVLFLPLRHPTIVVFPYRPSLFAIPSMRSSP